MCGLSFTFTDTWDVTLMDCVTKAHTYHSLRNEWAGWRRRQNDKKAMRKEEKEKGKSKAQVMWKFYVNKVLWYPVRFTSYFRAFFNPFKQFLTSPFMRINFTSRQWQARLKVGWENKWMWKKASRKHFMEFKWGWRIRMKTSWRKTLWIHF